MTRSAAGISPVMLQQYLSGLSYPATRQDLFITAMRNEAPSPILDVIERFSKEKFMGPQEVHQAYGDMT